jgi:polyhydroxyalkanoate synthesis regulator phasin
MNKNIDAIKRVSKKRNCKYMKKIFWIVGGSIFLVGAIMFGAFFAGPLLASAHTGQSNAATTTPTTTNPYCTQYLQDLANRLGVSVSTLQQDKLSAREDVLAQMVKDGKLTQSQANAIKQQLQSHQACTGKGDRAGRGIVLSSLKQYLPNVENQVAQGLKLTSSQLTTDLKNGQSLNQIATAQGVSSSQLHTIVLNAVQSAVNQAVKDGNLTQTQGTDFMKALQQHPATLDHLFDRHFHTKA